MDRRQLLLHLAHMPGTQSEKILAQLKTDNGLDKLLGASILQLRKMGLTENNAKFIAAIDGAIPTKTLAWLNQDHHEFIDYFDDRYPALLREISGSPFGLFVVGQLGTLAFPQIAIVGSRKATPGSKAFTYQLAGELVDAGLVITSGLAQGIDALAHQGALQGGLNTSSSQAFCTLAVLGHGLHLIYPRRHQQMANAIAERGALVSEFAPGVPVMPHHFPRRNRIISGMSLACVVVEAAEKSGSLITAHYALEHNREVFAVPGAVGNRQAKGSNQLLKDGAILIDSAQDIIDHLQGFQSHSVESCESNAGNHQEKQSNSLLSHIGFEATSFDLLLERSGQSLEQINADLLSLEIEGKISCVAGGYIRNC